MDEVRVEGKLEVGRGMAGSWAVVYQSKCGCCGSTRPWRFIDLPEDWNDHQVEVIVRLLDGEE